jgi:chemotaxis protein CheD
MANILIGIGEMKISTSPGDILKTMALGSSVAVIFLSPKQYAAGLVHVVLPDSLYHGKRLSQLPGYFADSAIPCLLRELQNGVDQFDTSEIQVKLAGGSSILDPDNIFNIGQKNISAIETVLKNNLLTVAAKDTGKNFSRSVEVEVFTGKVFVSAPGRGKWEI